MYDFYLMTILAVFLKKATMLPYSVAKQLKQSEVGKEENDELTFDDEIDNNVEDSIENDESVTVKIFKMSAKKKKAECRRAKEGKFKKGD